MRGSASIRSSACSARAGWAPFTRRSTVSALTSTGSVIGTPHYLAPEQIKDARSATAASDQYALGVIFYRCLTDTNPFEGDSVFSVLQAIVTEMPTPLRHRRGDLPEGLDRVVARA